MRHDGLIKMYILSHTPTHKTTYLISNDISGLSQEMASYNLGTSYCYYINSGVGCVLALALEVMALGHLRPGSKCRLSVVLSWVPFV